MRHCAGKLCDKCVYVKLNLSVNCENFGESFLFPLLKSALSSLGVCLHPVCSNCLTFLLVSNQTCDASRSGRLCSPADTSGLVHTHLWRVSVDEWLFRSVFFIYVVKCGSAPAQLTISLTWKCFWSFFSLFCHLCSKSLRPHVKDGLLSFFFLLLLLLSLVILVGFKK